MRKSQPGLPRSRLLEPRSRLSGLNIPHVIVPARQTGLTLPLLRMPEIKSQNRNNATMKGTCYISIPLNRANFFSCDR